MGGLSRKALIQTVVGVGVALCAQQISAQQARSATAVSATPDSAAAAAVARAASAAPSSDPGRRAVSLNAVLSASGPVVTLEALSSIRMLEQLRELQAKVLALNPPPPPAQAQPPKSSASAPPPSAELLALQKVLEPPPPAPPRLNRVAAIYGPQYALQAEIIKHTGEVIVVKPGVVHESLRVLNITPDLVELEVRTPVSSSPPGAGSQRQTSATDQSQQPTKRRRAAALNATGPAPTPLSSEVLVLRLRVGATFE